MFDQQQGRVFFRPRKRRSRPPRLPTMSPGNVRHFARSARPHSQKPEPRNSRETQNSAGCEWPVAKPLELPAVGTSCCWPTELPSSLLPSPTRQKGQAGFDDQGLTDIMRGHPPVVRRSPVLSYSPSRHQSPFSPASLVSVVPVCPRDKEQNPKKPLLPYRYCH